MRSLCAALLLQFMAAAAFAAAEPALEKRAHALADQLRCLVCQNQTIADSSAPLAVDLKNQVREQLAAGRSEQQVIDFMVERYGEFVLYRPPVKSTTWLLWFGPFALLTAGIAALLWKLRADGKQAANLTAAERERAAALLAASNSNEEGK